MFKLIGLLLISITECFVHCGPIEYACVSSDGLHMQAGHTYVPSRCRYCTCQSSGEITCATMECSPLPGCEKSEVPPGGCCPVCVDDGPLLII